MRLPDPNFWRSKRVLLTGHTGFKGAWAALWLNAMGAEVYGLALAPETTPNLFTQANVAAICHHAIADLRDGEAVRAVVATAKPEIVLHLGAQALVRRSYRDPIETFETNVMGTANLLEALAHTASTRAILVITSDKVYANDESGRAFREEDALGGHDPYSASKAAAEHVVKAYRGARFKAFSSKVGTGLREENASIQKDNALGTSLATARGGNVIGGGDFSEDRIVPDIVRAAAKDEPLILRSPGATRPWQHVLDCLAGYFVFAEILASGGDYPTALNIGPDPTTPITVAQIAEALLPALRAFSPTRPFGSSEVETGSRAENASKKEDNAKHGWQLDPAAANAPREMTSLALDPARARALGIGDRLPGKAALSFTAEWYSAIANGEDARAFSLSQIARYSSLSPRN